MRRIVALLLIMLAPPAMAQHAQHDGMSMEGLLGPQAMTREGSGTSWQPEAAPMTGPHFMGAHGMVMLHGFVDVVYDRQGGPRGDEMVYVPGMLMAMGRVPLPAGALGLRAMVSPDPAMGASGYPLLFQTGETADGATPLVDRQHPHDLFMELAASYSLTLGDGSVFAYGGLPGEPALGPSAFMHRASGMAIPEAPLTHHWLDSTHITFGVVTLGATSARWKVEGSVFNGREPDESRWNLETDTLDSYAARLTFNPDPHWSLQASHGYLVAPEQIEPDENVHRTTASVSHVAPQPGGSWSTTLAAGFNNAHGETRPAYLLESARATAPWTCFGRLEYLRNGELFEPPSPLAGRTFGIAKLSAGASRTLARAGALSLQAGVLASVYRYPDTLEDEYGRGVVSGLVFVRAATE